LNLDYRPPHRNQVQRLLKRLHTLHTSRLIKFLRSIDFLGVTIDFWSDRKQTSYLCLTGHHVDDEFTFKSMILYFGAYHHRHFATNIADEVEQRLRDLNILEKVISVTRDGAKNMVNAFDSFRRL
jgi:hypothetical protein